MANVRQPDSDPVVEALLGMAESAGRFCRRENNEVQTHMAIGNEHDAQRHQAEAMRATASGRALEAAIATRRAAQKVAQEMQERPMRQTMGGNIVIVDEDTWTRWISLLTGEGNT